MNADLKIKIPEVTVNDHKPTVRAGADRLLFPSDLSEWSAKEALLGIITGLVESFKWDNPELGKYIQAHPDYHPKKLLRLLCYAYATGVFAAHEIESNSYADPLLRQICEGNPPRAREISRFRRNNRGLLKWVLAQLLKEVLRQKFALREKVFPAGLRQFLFEAAVERLDLARHLDGVGDEI